MNYGGANSEGPATMIKHYVVIVACVVVLLAVLRFALPFGILFVGETTSRFRYADVNRQMYETIIRPTADWVREFRKREGRFPTEEEINAHAKELSKTARWIGIISEAPPWIKRRWQMGTDFMLIGNTGEWNLYYYSWNGEERKYWTD